MKTRYLTVLGIISIAVLISFSACINPRKGYAPKQPIPFSHQLHAGENQIPCRYCHVSVGEGPHASVPGVNTCMNCHNLIKEVPGNPGVKSKPIAQIQEAWDSGEPIEWVKVHDLPDHAQFSHTPHINFGFDCSECHGQVNSMDVVETQNAFNMGWCVNCHRQPEHNASVDCVTCHY